MASNPITSWQIERENVEAVTDFLFMGSKITVDGDCNHNIIRWWLLGRKARTSLDSVLRSKGITLPTKIHVVKAMVFPGVMYWCESWTVKKAKHKRIDAFELWWCRKLLKVTWTARRSNQSILKEINLNTYWKGWCWRPNTLATWCKEMTHWKRPSWWERLRAGGEGGDIGWDG